MTLAALLFVSMGALTKALGGRLPASEIAFARAFVGFLLVLPLCLRAGWSLVTTPHRPLLLARALLGTLGMTAGFYAVVHLPLAEATTLGFTKPLFLVPLAALILSERVPRSRWTATAVGFLGVLLVLRPGAEMTTQPAGLIALSGALCAAMVGILVRRLVLLERPEVLLFWLGLVSIPVTGALAAARWTWPTPAELPAILAVGTLGTLSQFALMRAYRIAEASALAPFEYMRLPIALLLGWGLFAEWPPPRAFAGTGIIVAATLFLIARERHDLARIGARPAVAPECAPAPCSDTSRRNSRQQEEP